MPLCPVNQRMPRRSNVAVFRFAYSGQAGSGNRRPRCVRGVDADDRVQPAVGDPAAPSGPTITPCGDEPHRAGRVGRRPSPGPAGRARRVPGPCTRPSRRRGCDVVRMRPGGHGVLPYGEPLGSRGQAAPRSRERGEQECGDCELRNTRARHHARRVAAGEAWVTVVPWRSRPRRGPGSSSSRRGHAGTSARVSPRSFRCSASRG